MSRLEPLFSPTRSGGVGIGLPQELRDVLVTLCEQLEELIATGDAVGDPALARLSPAAHPDDPLRQLEFEQLAGDDLAAGRLAALREVRATAGSDSLSEEQADTWLRALNDLRLVLGVRLELTEDSVLEDFADDEAAVSAFDLYGWLGEMQGQLLLAVDPEAVEPEVPGRN